ncbi:AAA family ATPase [Litoreibacter sp.]|nr:AAA family ATPase [Litoreibacter sp.]
MTELIDRIVAVPHNRHRRVIAIAGPPASGKSTVAEKLAAQIDNACVLPMDGFHLDNAVLDARGLRHRKGAPQTFDADGFVSLIRSLQTPGPIAVPTFDRDLDAVVPNGASILANCDTVMVEGNYLLLDTSPWDQLSQEWDFSIYLDVPLDILRERLIQRWLDHGFNHEDAVKKAESNDIPNAEEIVQNGFRADLNCTNWGKPSDFDL